MKIIATSEAEVPFSKMPQVEGRQEEKKHCMCEVGYSGHCASWSAPRLSFAAPEEAGTKVAFSLSVKKMEVHEGR